MTDTFHRDHQFDNELVQRLPLPLAQLYRRAHNAKTSLERHQSSYYLWEAALKLLGCVAVIEYVELGDDDAMLAERLRNLARPAIGHWWEFVRRLVPVLGAAGDEHFDETNRILLGRTRDDVPRAAALDAALCEVLEGKRVSRTTVRLCDLWNRLVQYRNHEIGHGAAGQKDDEYYERMSRTMLLGVADMLGKLDVLAGRRMTYVADVRRQKSGSWLIDRYELIGETARRIEPLEFPETATSRLPRPDTVHLESVAAESSASAPVLRSLQPLLFYDAERSEVFFLNGRRGKSKADYLCYGSGMGKRDGIDADHRALLARALGTEVDESAVRQWAENSLAEEPASADDPAEPAQRAVGEFELLSRVGRGGMGVVYRAWQPSLDRQVALKCLLRSGDPKSDARFSREIHALGRIDHPHVVKTYTSGLDDDQWYYAMELIEGTDLGQVCDVLAQRAASEVTDREWKTAVSTACDTSRTQEEPLSTGSTEDSATSRTRVLPPPAIASEGGRAPVSPAASRGHIATVVKLMRQVAQATHALHEVGVVHRDIKPGNIMVDSSGSHAVLMDLGLAQLADESDGRLTRTRQFVGTLRYASPEQVHASAPVDRRSDIYSLGATLWELLTLRPMYGATQETPSYEVEQRILFSHPESLRKINRNIPADLEAIVQKCLEKDPGRRYDTAREVAKDLECLLGGDPVKARPIGIVRRSYRWIKRRPIRATIAAAALLMAIGLPLGYRYWHAKHGTSVEYYANWQSRWGTAEGVYPLDPDEITHCGETARITYQGGRVVRVDGVNGCGYPCPVLGEMLIGELDEKSPACSILFKRNAQGEVIEQVALDRNDQVLWTFHFSTPTTGFYADERGLPLTRSKTEATFVEFVYSDKGHLAEIRYLDKRGKPLPNQKGICGSRREYNERGLEVSRSYFGIDGQPALHIHGFAKATIRYNERGSYEDVAYWGLDGERTLHDNGMWKWTCEYDEYGNQTGEMYFGVDGKPTPHKGGNAGWTARFDERGNKIEKAYLDTNGKPTVNDDGYARVVFEYDERGNATRRVYYGVDGNPTCHKDGNAGWTSAYDERGNELERMYLGVDGNPTCHKDGNAGWTSEYDERGNELVRTYLGVDGNLTAIDDGYARVVREYDEYGNITRRMFLGVDGIPTCHKDGYAGWTSEYDERGNELELMYLGVDGNPTCHKDGYAGWTSEYDERGNELEKTYVGVDDNPTVIDAGYARVIREYDERGNATRRMYLGVDGKPTWHKDGNAGYAAKYDELGNELERTYLGIDGTPTPIDDCYARVVREYDERGNVIHRRYFGVDGESTRHKDGEAADATTYDERGNSLEIRYLDAEGNLTLTQGSYARTVHEYNEHGKRIRGANFGIDGKPARHTDGHCSFTASYDNRGNQTEYAYFDEDGNLTIGKQGYAKWTAEFDDWGNKTALRYFGADDQPICLKRGHAGQTAAYDERGNEIARTYLGVDGKPTLIDSGYARIECEYDERGNITSRRYFGVDGKSTRHKDGEAAETITYDERGNELEIQYLDAEGNPTLTLDAYARVVYEYDEHGNTTHGAYFGIDGKPARHTDGHCSFTASYDNRGNQTEYAYFDEDGKLTIGTDGYAKWSAEFDDWGNKTALRHFGADDQPICHEDGYASWTAVYDERGNELEKTHLGVDGQPTLVDDGYARVVFEYDKRGNVTRQSYLGVDGKPTRHENGYTNLTVKHDDLDRIREIVSSGYNEDRGYAARRLVFDERENLLELAYLGTDGELVGRGSGIAKTVCEYDSEDNTISKEFLGTDGRPVRGADGSSKWLAKYDANGKLAEKTFMGFDGSQGYAQRRCKYNSQGRETEIAYCDERGTPVLCSQGYAKKTLVYDDEGNLLDTAFFGLDGAPVYRRTEKGGFQR